MFCAEKPGASVTRVFEFFGKTLNIFFFSYFGQNSCWEKFVKRDYTRNTRSTHTPFHPSNHAIVVVVVVVVARSFSPRVSSSLRASGGRTSDGLENDDDAEDRRRFVFFASVFFIIFGCRFGGDVTRVRETVLSALQRVFRREKRDQVALLDGHEHENSFG